MGRSYTLHTLRKGLAVLEVLAAAKGELSLTELAHGLAESRTGVFRLLRTLQEQGYVEQDPRSKRYRLGLRIWEIGRRAIRRSGLVEVAQPTVRWLAEVTGDTAMLAVLRDTEVLYLDVAVGASPLRVCVETGSRAPAYASASGKAMLAHHPELLPAVVRRGMKRITRSTLTRQVQLRRRLAEIRRTGLSVARGERRAEITSMAAPVFDGQGHCVAAVSLAGPATRYKDEMLEELKRHVRKAAGEISAQLGGVPAPGGRWHESHPT